MVKHPHKTLKELFGRMHLADIKHFSDFKDSSLASTIAFFLLCVIVTTVLSITTGYIPLNVRVGQIATHDIKADHAYEIIDQEATDKFRNEVLKGVSPVYDFRTVMGRQVVDRVASSFTSVRRQLPELWNLLDPVPPGKPVFSQLREDQLTQLKREWEELVGVEIDDRTWSVLVADNFSDEAEKYISALVLDGMSAEIILDKENLLQEKDRGIVVRVISGDENVKKPEDKIYKESDLIRVLSLEEAKREIKKSKRRFAQIDNAELKSVARNVASDLLQPNLVLNLDDYDRRKKDALKNIQNVVIKVEAGQSIIRGGDKYEPWHLVVLEGMRIEKGERSTFFVVVGTFLLTVIVLFLSYYFGIQFIRKFAPSKSDLYFLGTILVLYLISLRFGLAFVSAITENAAFDIPRTALSYAIPVGAAAMLTRFILNSETAIIFSVIIGIFTGIVVQGDSHYDVYTLLSSIAAASAIAYSDKRSSIIRAGFITGGINVLIVIAIKFLTSGSLTSALTVSGLLWYIGSALVGGLGCAIIVMVVTPLAEAVFKYTTDIKLLELANLNHPLLRELVIRAPGTYHHSHLVGILAESAAEAVGAKPLLTRVAAYYHDIGKIKKPQYFSENMRDSESSKYEKLNPHMSSLIISSHVKDGIELAKQHGLPPVILDMIPQHHGTKMISFFFEKAKLAAETEGSTVDEKDFRYPGPKPQTREAGILLLADSVEAAVRGLREKSPTRIRQIVDTVIDKSFSEAQLDECELTLKNLHEIANIFTRILMGIYHQRVEYPKETLQISKKEVSIIEEPKKDENKSGPDSSNGGKNS